MTVTVLASGGWDSTTCIAHYLRYGYDVRTVWVDYGHCAASAEAQAVTQIATYYNVPVQRSRIQGLVSRRQRDGLLECRARNLALTALASNIAEEPGLIVLGIHAGTRFPDCTQFFAESLNELLVFLTDGQIRLDCPFVTWSKFDIAVYSRSIEVPIALTYSCEEGLIPPCGVCTKRREKEAILASL